MSEEDAKAFKLDKKFPMEIYLADADGSNVERLTTADGYDGGPFFSADGKEICWRVSTEGARRGDLRDEPGRPEGTPAHETGAMSWAPYFHPSGDYLIFATNKHGFENFELYLVDAKGEKEPVRVTHTDGIRRVAGLFPRRENARLDEQPHVLEAVADFPRVMEPRGGPRDVGEERVGSGGDHGGA